MSRFVLAPSLLLVLGLAACGDKDGDDTGAGGGGGEGGDTDTDTLCDRDVDADCDGVPDEDDCDPEDPRTYPGAVELPYDGADNDCAGDGDLMDVDGDGFDGPVGVGPDCNDNNPEVNPDAAEVCYDGIDQNCDGEPVVGETESPDCDGDGYDGYGVGAPDCDDEDPTVNPGAAEVWYDGADQNCNGHIFSDYDADLDGDDHADYGGTDCDDTDPLTYGTEENGDTRAELLDGVDRNCDGAVDRITIFDATYAWYGNSMSNDGLFGKGLVVVDDYDGDGTPDLVVGGPWSDDDTEICLQDGTIGNAAYCGGWLQVLLNDGNDGTPPDVAHATYKGDAGDPAGTGAYGDWVGYDLANLGDLDGDGWAEIASGNPLGNEILVFDGGALQAGGALSAGDVLARAAAGTFLGFDVAALGDVTGDGTAELVGGLSDGWVGAQAAGAVLQIYVWPGETVASDSSLSGSDALFAVDHTTGGGEAVGGPDFDGDGLPDLIAAYDTYTDGAFGAGKVFVVPSADIAAGGNVSADSFPALRGGSGDALGIQNGFMEDLDGDGTPELVVAASLATTAADGAGEVYVISGEDVFTSSSASAAAFITIQGSDTYGRLGPVGEDMGDIDADGLDDLVVTPIGGTALNSITGVAHVFYGADIQGGGTWVDTDGAASLPTRNADDQWGLTGVVTDLDADGDGDLVMAAPLSSGFGMAAVFESYWVP